VHLIQPGVSASAPYSDVSSAHPYADFISLLKEYGVAQECAPGSYCPEATTTRVQMAVLIIRAVMGGDSFAFPQAAYFTDVPASHAAFKYVQKMRELGITVGCTETTYCPTRR